MFQMATDGSAHFVISVGITESGRRQAASSTFSMLYTVALPTISTSTHSNSDQQCTPPNICTLSSKICTLSTPAHCTPTASLAGSGRVVVGSVQATIVQEC
jgi:hypothetical protein